MFKPRMGLPGVEDKAREGMIQYTCTAAILTKNDKPCWSNCEGEVFALDDQVLDYDQKSYKTPDS